MTNFGYRKRAKWQNYSPGLEVFDMLRRQAVCEIR